MAVAKRNNGMIGDSYIKLCFVITRCTCGYSVAILKNYESEGKKVTVERKSKGKVMVSGYL